MHANAEPVSPPPTRPRRAAGRGALEPRLVLGIAGVFSLAAFPDLPPPLVLAAAILPLGLIAAARNLGSPLGLAIATVASLALSALPGLSGLWPAPPLLALGVYLIATRAVPALGGRPAWLAAGRIGPAEVAIAAVFAVAAVAALLIWTALARPDLADLQARLPTGLSLPLLVGTGLTFAVLNAIAEEALFRGILQDALASALRSTPLALTLQAVAFGLAHFQGFPRGWSGVALATLYGAMMGGLRLRTGGILLPILAHVVADATIFAILVGLAG